MAHLRYEAWPAPGITPYTVVVRDLQAVSGSGSLAKRPIGNGAVEIPKGMLRADDTRVVDAVVFTDAVTPANDVTSTIRVYRPGDTAPIHEWLTEDPVAEGDDADTIRLSGRNIEAVLDYEHVEVWDWDASAVFQSKFPDHIYGGRNIVTGGSFEEQNVVNEVYELWNDQIALSTFTLTMESDTTAAIAFDATAATVETELEATTGITQCLVTGAGTEADPWKIEFTDPSIISPDMTVADSGGLTSTLELVAEGELSILPWTVSETLARGVNFNHGAHASNSPAIIDTVAYDGTYSLWFNGLNQFAGVQRVLKVTPGGLYQASMWARTSSTTDAYRVVIRTLTEEFIASSTPFAGSTMAANTWTEFTIDDVTIPDGVTEVVMRFAYVGTGNPTPIATDLWSLTEGMAPVSTGQILIDLFDDAQTDHAPTRAALTFINLDFTAAVDSAGVAWDDTALSITIKRGQSYFQMMRQLEKLGYQWRLVPTSGTPGEWDLQVYNDGGMANDYGGVDDPAIVVGQGTLPSNITRQRPVANYVMAEGSSGLTSRIFSTTSIAATGRRSLAVRDRRFTGTDPLTTWATARLNNYLAETLAPRVTIMEPPETDLWPRPLDEYVPSDIVDFVLADGATRVERIVEQVTYSDEAAAGLRWTVDGGSAEPFISATPSGAGPGNYNTGPGGYTPRPYASEGLRVIGTAVAAILEEFRFEEDPDESGLPLTTGAGILPAFTIRVAASDARAESKKAADIICYGGDDTFQIVTADDIVADLGFGDIVLSEGNFYVSTAYTQPATSRLRGLGPLTTTLVVDNVALTFNGDKADFAIREIDPCA